MGARIGLRVEAREEGHHPVEGQAQQTYTDPPGDVRCGHFGGSFPLFVRPRVVGVTVRLRLVAKVAHPPNEVSLLLFAATTPT